MRLRFSCFSFPPLLETKQSMAYLYILYNSANTSCSFSLFSSSSPRPRRVANARSGSIVSGGSDGETYTFPSITDGIAFCSFPYIFVFIFFLPQIRFQNGTTYIYVFPVVACPRNETNNQKKSFHQTTFFLAFLFFTLQIRLEGGGRGRESAPFRRKEHYTSKQRTR